MRHCALFAGVDAVGTAVEALGGETVSYSEVDEHCVKVLRKTRPQALSLGDVTKVDWEEAQSESPFIFASAGFPCQDLSVAGNGEGLDGERSGLYTEVIRMISEAQPKLALIENVPRLLKLHFERLLRDLAEAGYDCEWDTIPAASVGAPHLRWRLWILAYPSDGLVRARALGRPICWSGLNPWKDDGVKWPNAGKMTSGIVFESERLIPSKGAIKRVDGRSYWIGRMLFDTMPATSNLLPTPSAVSYGSNQGGAAGRVGEKRHSLESLARLGLLPTPEASDGTGGRVSADLGGIRPSGAKRSVTLATAVAHSGLWPSPSRADGTGGPGTSPKREGGKNLRTEVNEREGGMLEPNWVEWMMGIPVGTTDLSCADPVYMPYSEEPFPRVSKDSPYRRQRLQAIGNSLVWLIPYVLLSRYRDQYGLPGSHINMRAFEEATA